MKKIILPFFLFLAFVLCQMLTGAEIKRALVIGIDIYNPNGTKGRWMNLDGCVNDAESVNQLLQARYGFSEQNIHALYNENASRENILNGITEMLSDYGAGDIAVIYYAGHGSQVKNSLSDEKDLRDESMVPADSYLGTPDIRDKELAVLFNKFADKGVILTVLYDCCHSGSIGRGAAATQPAKLRHIEEDPFIDAKDPSIVSPPEKRGVLIMSASQDFEFASEQVDQNGMPHGAFTIALLQSLTTLPVSSSASDIFSSTRAILKYNGKSQEPVLAATEDRKSSTIFGISKGILSGKTKAAVLNVKDGQVILQGGFALGIYPESELSCQKDGVNLSIKVTAVNNINKCTATVTHGDIGLIKPGDLFELNTWRMPEGAMLKVYITPSLYSYAELVAIAENIQKIATTKNITLVTDPIKEAPTHTVFFSEGSWYLGLPDNRTVNIGSKPEAKTILKNLPEGSRLYISLPPPKELESNLKSLYTNELAAVSAVSAPSEAQYYLTGRLVGNSLEYAYFIPQATNNVASMGSTMPLRTDYFKMNDNPASVQAVADSLLDYSLRMARIKAWLTLAPPPDDGSFPFKLCIKNATTDRFLTQDDQVKVGDILGFYLELDEANLSYWDKSRRYVYVFSIDSKGEINLWFPLNGSVENRAPWLDAQANIIKLSALGRPKLLRVTEPCGTDTYIILTTSEPITNPEVLSQPGIMNRGGESGFSQLLNVGSASRGELITPAEWGIQKIVLKSVPMQ